MGSPGVRGPGYAALGKTETRGRPKGSTKKDDGSVAAFEMLFGFMFDLPPLLGGNELFGEWPLEDEEVNLLARRFNECIEAFPAKKKSKFYKLLIEYKPVVALAVAANIIVVPRVKGTYEKARVLNERKRQLRKQGAPGGNATRGPDGAREESRRGQRTAVDDYFQEKGEGLRSDGAGDESVAVDDQTLN